MACDARNRPQILQHICESLTITIFETLWVPCSARFVALGSTARNTGALYIYELEGNKLKKLKEAEKHNSFKCGTFAASSLVERHLATGDFKGTLFVWDLERLSLPIWHVKKAHDTIVNAMDGCGGLNIGYGAPEIVTGGRDGRVRIWDQRQKDDPVVSFDPKTGDVARDCWTVAFGNSYNDEERCVLAGYDNGDVKLFDLRVGKVRWQTTLSNGICGIDFDRKDIKMNKFVCTTLESKLHLYNLRVYHPEKGYSSLEEKLKHGTTVWGVKHLPQNREVFVTLGGDGSLSLYKYSYPDQPSMKDGENREYGIVGKVELLNHQTLATQPISCLNWSPDKTGLAVCASFDQCLRTIVVTKLQKL
jgi:WD40 repeat protein